jgi:PAS domain S-box-containing protein
MKYEQRLEKLSEYINHLNSVDSLEFLYQITYEILEVALGFLVLDIIEVKDGFIEDIKRDGVNKEPFRAPLDGPGITVRAANTGKIQMINNLRQDEDYLQGTRQNSMLSELSAPVFVNEKVFLILNVESEKINAFDEHDKKLIEIFSRSMGSAIERLLYLETIVKQNRDIESVKQRTNFIVENAPYIIAILDLYGKVKYVNKQFTEVLGYNKEEIIGKRYSKLPSIRPRDAIKLMKILLSLRKGEVPMPFSMKFVTNNGEILEMKISIILYESIQNEREIIVMARVTNDESLIYNSTLSNPHKTPRL